MLATVTIFFKGENAPYLDGKSADKLVDHNVFYLQCTHYSTVRLTYPRYDVTQHPISKATIFIMEA